MAVTRYCGPGLFWDQQRLRCDVGWKVTCMQDICQRPRISHHNMAGNCRAYWACKDGRSFPACCAKGYAYFPGQGCLPGTQCRDACPVKCRMTSACNLRPDPASPRKYHVMLGLMGRMTSSCSFGAFDLVTCSCSADQVFDSGCTPHFSMPFSHLQVYGNRDVRVDKVIQGQGFGIFLGDAKISVPMTLMDIVSRKAERPLRISLRYRESSPLVGNEKRILLQSSPCNYGGLIVVYVDKTALYLRLFVQQGEVSSAVLLTEGFSFSRWKDLNIRYSPAGVRMTVTAGPLSHATSITMPRGLSVSECGWAFGLPEGLDHLLPFIGAMDDIQISYC
ncbi:protein PIF-like [Littorina saxatilis]|uniref:protein PIF-like n=1 Tax=Littorina saxatilis TaxID=31220 RepID=UPI0038B61E8D